MSKQGRPIRKKDRLIRKIIAGGDNSLTPEEAAGLLSSSGAVAQEQPKQKSDRIVINLVDTPIWRLIIARGVHEYNRRYYEQSESIFGKDNTVRALLEPSMKFAEDTKLKGDDLLEICEGAFEMDQHRTGSIQVTRDFVDNKLTPLMAHLEATTSKNFRWSQRTVLVMVLFLYANFLQKNTIKRTELLA